MQGAVLVTVKKATDLPAADGNGLSDPYVRMMLDEKKKKSTVQRRTLSPTWNEKHEWLHVSSHHSAKRLHPAHQLGSCASSQVCLQHEMDDII